MSDMRSTIVPKSDQLNFDDFVGGQTKTIKITGVKILGGDQPVALSFEGDDGKPYKPGKSMRRVLVHVWGENGNAYIGRSLKLYGDPTVKFGGMAVGGIRISHMSDITEPISMPLTETRGKKKQYTVEPLVVTPSEPSPIDNIITLAKAATTSEELEQLCKDAQVLKGWTKAKTAEMGDVLKAKRQQFKSERQPGE